jgi:hypothetical protein
MHTFNIKDTHLTIYRILMNIFDHSIFKDLYNMEFQFEFNKILVKRFWIRLNHQFLQFRWRRIYFHFLCLYEQYYHYVKSLIH